MPTLTALLITLLVAPATDGMTPPVPPTPELPSYGGLLLRTLIALVVVVGLAWVLLRWGLRRVLPGGAGGRPLRVVARAPLDGRRAVVLVEAAGRYLLLGVGEGSPSLLAELEPAAVDRALAEEAAGRPKAFATVLRERLSRPGTRPGKDRARQGPAEADPTAQGAPPKPPPREGDDA